MFEKWKNTAVTDISIAVHVLPASGKIVHKDRPFHGFVLNDDVSEKDYCFSDGRILKTKPNELFYLPKHTSYSVRILTVGSCYAINFDADVTDEPFSVPADTLKKSFAQACSEWKRHDSTAHASAMLALYEAFRFLQWQDAKKYVPKDKQERIRPAIESIDRAFTDNALTVASLAKACGMSEVYFRQIFAAALGTSPKEYIIVKRIAYAKQLLASGQFSVEDTAIYCGYREACQFSREFKKRVGVSPQRYINSTV